jgi:hypothetical protein
MMKLGNNALLASFGGLLTFRGFIKRRRGTDESPRNLSSKFPNMKIKEKFRALFPSGLFFRSAFDT